jgi:hypothetical protein
MYNMNLTLDIDSGHLTMKGSTKATIKTSIRIVGTGTELPITIEGEFKDIPTHLHETYIQSMLTSYTNVNVHDNTKEEEEPYPMTIEEQQREWRLNKIVDLICKGIRKK